ncbi:restriction endonuclease subunit S [Escherichia coli]|nr:restriction endonuclease subunit S [Escherichia coli]
MSQYRAYPAYKDSGIEWIGQVPEHWKVARVKRLVSLRNERRNDVSTDTIYIGLEDVEAGSGQYKPTNGSSRQSEDSTVGIFYEGDVLYGKLRPYLRKAIISEMAGCCSTEFLVLRAEKTEPRWLQEWLLTPDVTHQIESGCEGAKMPRADWGHIGSIEVVYPDQPEQAQILTTLDRETARIDALVEKKTRFIELLKEKRQALITHAVTKGLDPNVKMKDSGVEWIGQVPEEWKTGKLKHLGTLKGGSGFPTDMQGQPDNELPFYKVGDLSKSRDNISLNGSSNTISRKDAKELGATVFPENTISWAKIGAALFLNRRRISKTACCLDNNMTGFVVDSKKVPIQYAFYLMNAIDFSFFARPGAVPSLSEGEQSAIPIAIPSYEESFSIAATLERETARIDALIGKAEQSITLLKERRAAFITAAVTGQIDLRGKQ